MTDTVTITIPRRVAEHYKRRGETDPGSENSKHIFEACRQALQQEQVVLEGNSLPDENFGTVVGESFQMQHQNLIPLGPVRITITPLEGEQNVDVGGFDD